MSFAGLGALSFLASLDATSLSTALPVKHPILLLNFQANCTADNRAFSSCKQHPSVLGWHRLSTCLRCFPTYICILLECIWTKANDVVSVGLFFRWNGCLFIVIWCAPTASRPGYPGCWRWWLDHHDPTTNHRSGSAQRSRQGHVIYQCDLASRDRVWSYSWRGVLFDEFMGNCAYCLRNMG
jgi:hypothetical protein